MLKSAALAETPPPLRRGRPRKSEQERDESLRRAELVRAAAQLFRARGFDATPTRDIAAAAGMQSGSPFYYFESKSALLLAVMCDGMAQAKARQDAALQALPARAPARERLRALIRQHFEVLLGADSDFIPVMLYEWRSLTAEQRQQVAAQKDIYEAAWMPSLNALHRAGHLQARPAVARLFIFGALNWTVQWFDPAGPRTLDDLTEQALCLFVGKA
ncbi:MAG: TetR family transcriptional regulator [Proteobacteria bacterium]|uniref:TetR/AcrR family transcriptional regulator n=1 Tax=Ottowia sp. TaxID=1898956 RepID=UPI001D5F025B|nr:TetR/AcrR family transcriptional regulator [Ottowia sp.]MBS0403493.1 TetR family transcriptional regulator [Pseudomonadota bacterium]MBS0413624.1 TetR family transcriptional regulator [Pseudomonadota bacterium]